MLRLLLYLCLGISFSPLPGQTLDVMSYNIRYANPGDGPDRWDLRKTDVANLINYYQPAFCGLQEAQAGQVDYLDEHCEGYAYIGVGRDDGKRGGEFSALLYDSARFELIEGGTFWLSPTPDVPSTGWDAALPRVCTYGRFRERATGRELYIFNTHFDHIGDTARLESARLIVDRIREMNLGNIPLVVMGDMNAGPEDAPIVAFKEYLDDPADAVPLYGPPGTFTAFARDTYPERRIDYILTKNAEIKSYRHIDDRRADNRWVSDHLPVLARLRLP